MAALRLKESGTHGARRLTHRRIAAALEILRQPRLQDVDVHAARKALKKARASLRLRRKPLGKRTYRYENAALRDVARALTALRDSTVLIDALEKVAAGSAGPQLRGVELNGLRRRLTLLRAGERQRLTRQPRTLTRIQRELRSACKRSARWQVGSQGWSALGKGFERSYGRGREAMRSAQSAPSDERWHEWRKQVEYLWHQLAPLQPASPGTIGRLVDELHRLSTELGEDHDLAMLRQKACKRPQPFQDAVAREHFLARIDASRSRLQRNAAALGRQLYRDAPQVFAARLEDRWHSWRRGKAIGGMPASSRRSVRRSPPLGRRTSDQRSAPGKNWP